LVAIMFIVTHCVSYSMQCTLYGELFPIVKNYFEKSSSEDGSGPGNPSGYLLF
jgi:hypothetical protein